MDEANSYKELPELTASALLRENILKGPYHQVREEVIPYAGANHYSIDSHFGVFEAEGNEMLVRRIIAPSQHVRAAISQYYGRRDL